MHIFRFFVGIKELFQLAISSIVSSIVKVIFVPHAQKPNAKNGKTVLRWCKSKKTH